MPPRIFLSLVYKLEGPSDVGVALEVTAGDAGSCHIGSISVLDGELLGARCFSLLWRPQEWASRKAMSGGAAGVDGVV